MEPSERREARLVAMRYGAEDILLYEFAPTDGAGCEVVTAGAHLDLVLPGGEVRQYSLISTLCSAEHYVVAVKREATGRGASRWLHDSARVGGVFQIGRPRNLFALEEGATPVLLLAGGIGITPLYGMYRELRARQVPVHLHYWCKSPQQALFHRELANDPQVSLHYSRSAEGTQALPLAQVLGDAAADARVYCCGPERMIAELDQLTAGWAPGRVRVERFKAAEAPPPSAGNFSVVLARSGRELEVRAGESVLDVLRDADVDVMYSCEQGICGACEVKVLDGTPLHRDSVRSAQSHAQLGTMMVCCSGAACARLVLDL